MSLGKMFSDLMAQQSQQARETVQRKEVHNRIVKFLERFDFSSLAVSDKVKRVKGMSFDDFYLLLSRLNGELNSLPRSKYPDQARGSRPPWVRDNDGTIQYFVPEQSRALLTAFFEDMQTNISGTNVQRYAAKLEYALAFAHVFHDANGRTARYARRLLASKEPLEQDAVSQSAVLSRPSGPELVNRLAVYELFLEMLPEEDLKRIRIQEPEDVKKLVFAINSQDLAAYGYAFALRGLALRLALPDVEILDLLSSTKHYNALSQRDPEAFRRYKAHYAELQDKLFWKVQELLDQEKDFGNLPASFNKRISDLQNNVDRSDYSI